MEGLLNSSSTPPQILPSSPSRPLPPAAMRPAHRSSHRSHLLHFCLVSLLQTPSFPPSVPPLCLHPPRSLDGISQGRILTRLGWSLARLGCGVVGVGWRGGDLSPLLCSFSLVHFTSTTSKHCYLCPAFAFTLSVSVARFHLFFHKQYPRSHDHRGQTVVQPLYHGQAR